MPNAVAMKATIQEVWGPALHDGDDPSLTVHRLPETLPDELEKLAHSLSGTIGLARRQATTLQATVALPTSQPTEPGTQGGEILKSLKMLMPPAAGGGVAAQDYFALDAELGKGGMGVVYRARQQSLDRGVAVKTLLPSRTLSPAQQASFLREALTTGALAHPNIVPVYLFGCDEQGRLFLVMKEVGGRAWSKVLKQDNEGRNFDLSKHLEIFQKVCDAVAFAHAHKIVHRDLKPENVMVGEYGEVTVMDWGLALDVSGAQRPGLGMSRENASTIAGTPAYLAPEMALAQLDRIGPPTDVYLLGAILHELISGLPPHKGRTVWEVVEHAALGKLDEIKPRAGLPREIRELERIVRKALAQDPAARFADVAALQAEVRAFQAGQGDRAESDATTREAREALTKLAAETEDLRVVSPYYPRCADVLAKAQSALALWGFNPRAMRVRQEALALYADLAVRGRDWGLAESLLRDLRLSGAGGAALATPVEQRLREHRVSWERRQILLQRASRLGAALFFVTLVPALYFYYRWSETSLLLSNAEEKLIDQEKAPAAGAVAPGPVKTQFTSDPKETDPIPGHPRPTPPAERKTPPSDPLRLAPVQPETAWWLKGGDQDPAARLIGLWPGGGGRFILWDESGRAWFWRPFTPPPKPEATIFQEGKPAVTAAAWLDETTAVLGNERGEVLLGDSPERPWTTVLRAEGPVKALDGRKVDKKVRIVAGSAQGLWFGGEANASSETLDAPCVAVRLKPDGGLVFVSGNFINLRPVAAKPYRLDLGAKITRAVLDRDGMFVAVVAEGQEDRVNITELKSGRSYRFNFQKGTVACLAISPDGELVMAGSSEGEAAVFRRSTQKGGMLPCPAGKGGVRALGFSDDGAHAIVIDGNFGVRTYPVRP